MDCTNIYELFAKYDTFVDRLEADGGPQPRLDFDSFVERWESLDEHNRREWFKFFDDYNRTKQKTEREVAEASKRSGD